MERGDLLPAQRGLEREVELPKRLHRRKPARTYRRLQTTVVPQPDLRPQQPLDRFTPWVDDMLPEFRELHTARRK